MLSKYINVFSCISINIINKVKIYKNIFIVIVNHIINHSNGKPIIVELIKKVEFKNLL